MQKIKSVLIIALIGITVTGYSQVKDKDVMVKRIFEVIKNNDEDGFVKLFPDVATLRSMMEAFMKMDTSVNGQAEIKATFDEMSDSSLQKSFRRDFKRQIKKGEDKGIDWRKAEFVSYNADSAMVNEDGISTTRLKGTIYFKAAAKDYFLGFDEVIWFENKGWYGVSIRRIDEKDKENDQSTFEPGENNSGTLLVDSVMIAADTIDILEPPPPRKPVPKQPVKSKPGKTKTPTPARKP